MSGVHEEGGLTIGGLEHVGEWFDEFGNELGAVLLPRRPGANTNKLITSLQARNAQLQAAAKKQKALAPLAKVTNAATSAASAAIKAAAQARVKATVDFENQPTHVIPVCFDGIAAATASATATIKAPHNVAWRLLGMTVNDGQANGFRIISFTIANTEHVIASNVSFSAGSPTSPGIDAAIFATKNQANMLPQFRYRPWGLGRGGVLRSDAEIKIQVFNPGATAASLNLSLFVQSSPCGDDALYSTDKGGVFAVGSPQSESFMQNLRSGAMTLFPRAQSRGVVLKPRRAA